MQPGRADVIGAGGADPRPGARASPCLGRRPPGVRERHPRRHRLVWWAVADGGPGARPRGRGDHPMSELLPHPLTGQPFPSPVPPGAGWPEDPADARHAGGAQRSRGPHPRTAPRSPSSTRGYRSAARASGWSGGGRTAADQAGVVRRPALLGAAHRGVGGRPAEASSSSVSLRPRTAGTAPAGSSPGIAAGTGSSPRCTGSGWPRRRRRSTPGTASELIGARMVAAVRCAPPVNKPTTEERDTCAPWLRRELALVMPRVRAVVCLGSFGWAAAWRALGSRVRRTPSPAALRPRRRGRPPPARRHRHDAVAATGDRTG